jgi:hypothetical protein
MKRFVFALILICSAGLSAQAQEEQIYKPLILQLDEGKDVSTYVMESFSYSVTRYTRDTTSGAYPSVLSIHLSIYSNPDKRLAEWLTVPDKTQSGKILIRDSGTGTAYRKFEFKDASIISWSESVTEYGLKDNNRTVVYIEIKCHEFSMEEYPLKGIRSAYDDY